MIFSKIAVSGKKALLPRLVDMSAKGYLVLGSKINWN